MATKKKAAVPKKAVIKKAPVKKVAAKKAIKNLSKKQIADKNKKRKEEAEQREICSAAFIVHRILPSFNLDELAEFEKTGKLPNTLGLGGQNMVWSPDLTKKFETFYKEYKTKLIKLSEAKATVNTIENFVAAYGFGRLLNVQDYGFPFTKVPDFPIIGNENKSAFAKDIDDELRMLVKQYVRECLLEQEGQKEPTKMISLIIKNHSSENEKARILDSEFVSKNLAIESFYKSISYNRIIASIGTNPIEVVSMFLHIVKGNSKGIFCLEHELVNISAESLSRPEPIYMDPYQFQSDIRYTKFNQPMVLGNLSTLLMDIPPDTTYQLQLVYKVDEQIEN